nr:hypothetical protein [Halogeometricum sp. CBA1124]
MVTIDIESEEGQLEILRRMLTIREFDTKAGELFADGELPGFVHLYIGEEAVASVRCRHSNRTTTSRAPTAVTATASPRGWTPTR